MSKIKFRAWDIKNKCYIYISDLYWFEENHVHGFEDERYIFAQYIGLKDKNEKDIYEGDIIKIIDGHQYGTHQGFKYMDEIVEVYFEERELAYRTMYPTGNIWSGGSSMAWLYHRVEIIGNIHENPELLK